MDTVLSVRGVEFGYGRRTILDELSLDVCSGRSVSITGRSGSGKSTLLSVVAGLVRPRRGTVMLGDHRVDRLRPRALARMRRRHLGVVFQAGELLPSLTAVENVALPLLLDGRPWSEVATTVRSLLVELGVDGRSCDLPAGDLSGGERQRAAVARAVVTEPALLVADEPTGALDATTRDEVADLLFSLPRTRGCALLIVTHDPAIASRADEHFALVEGALIPDMAMTPPCA